MARWKTGSASALLLTAGLLALILTMAPARAQTGGPQTPACGNVKVQSAEVIDGRAFPSGTYRVNAFGISCAKVLGKYGLFDQFLSQDDSTPLPKPWRSLSQAIGAPKFAAAPGVGFRVQRISD